MIPIPIFNDVNGKFVMFDQQKVYLNGFTVILLREYICRRKNVDNSDNMKLWKVNVERKDIKDKSIYTKEDTSWKRNETSRIV